MYDSQNAAGGSGERDEVLAKEVAELGEEGNEL